MSVALSVSIESSFSAVVKVTVEPSACDGRPKLGSNAPLNPFGPWEMSVVVPPER